MQSVAQYIVILAEINIENGPIMEKRSKVYLDSYLNSLPTITVRMSTTPIYARS